MDQRCGEGMLMVSQLTLVTVALHCAATVRSTLAGSVADSCAVRTHCAVIRFSTCSRSSNVKAEQHAHAIRCDWRIGVSAREAHLLATQATASGPWLERHTRGGKRGR